MSAKRKKKKKRKIEQYQKIQKHYSGICLKLGISNKQPILLDFIIYNGISILGCIHTAQQLLDWPFTRISLESL